MMLYRAGSSKLLIYSRKPFALCSFAILGSPVGTPATHTIEFGGNVFELVQLKRTMPCLPFLECPATSNCSF